MKRRAWVLGDFQADDIFREIWIAEAKRNLVGVEPPQSFVGTHGALSEGDAILVRFDDAFPVANLDAIVEKGCRVVLYLPAGRQKIRAGALIQYCKRGVCDIVAGSTGPWSSDQFRKRLPRLYFNPPVGLYEKFDLAHLAGGGTRRVFIATPFREELGADFIEGAQAVLAARRMAMHEPGTVFRIGTINERVCKMIDESDLVLANLRQSEDGFNPNVWYELGYARKAAKPMIPFRHIEDPRKMPADIEGIGYREYETAVDVAMQLYWGLDWLDDAASD